MPPYYRVVDDFRPAVPHTVLSGVLRPRGLAGHTSEGGEGEAGFLGTVDFLIATAARSAGYHEGWYPKNGGFEARRITRPEYAAHSMNPRQPPWRNPPLARVQRILGDRWWDPNAVSYAICIAGSTGITIPRLINDAGFMAGARRRYAELRQQYASSLAADPLFNHGEGQADRTDWGNFRAALLAAPQEDDVPVPELVYVPQIWRAGPEGTHLRRQPVQVKDNVVGTVPPGTWIYTVAESKDGIWRLGVADDAADRDGEGLFWVVRGAMLEQPKGAGRDPELRAAIAAVVGRRINGEPGLPPGDSEDEATLREQLQRALQRIEAVRAAGIGELEKAQDGAEALERGLGAAITRVRDA
jgi:hypothetical protein